MASTSRITMSTQKSSADTRVQPLLFALLTHEGTNFLDWVNNAQVVLAAEDLD